MRQTPNNFTIIKSIEINLLYMFLAKEKSHFLFLLHLLFFFHKPQPFTVGTFPPIFFQTHNPISLSHVVPILPNGQMATINTINLFTRSTCERHSKSLSNKWQEDFVSCPNETTLSLSLSLSCCSPITKLPNDHN